MTSTSCSALARELLDRCLAGDPPAILPAALLEDACAPALFGILVEGLADRFEPTLCECYARLFAQAVAHASGRCDAPGLLARFRRVRLTRPVSGEPRRIVVLSRITLGADVAVTSVLLSAAKRRFPAAEILFAGPRKNYELFAADPRLVHADVPYPRGTLRERLAVWEPLESLLAEPGTVLLDPDSRLTQLGLLPVCPEERHHLFESRAYGADTSAPLLELAAAWARETLGVAGARPYIATDPPSEPLPERFVAVSLGVGGNLEKRLPDPFEEELLRLLAARGLPLYVDRGAGGEEAERVQRAVDRAGVPALFWDGSFAGFAALISRARLYAGYDSAGQHVASAAGVPLLCLFAGFPVPRMFDRWRPTGPAAAVIRVDRPDVAEALARVRAALDLMPRE